jgi:outer membrane lipoprotein SlyB
MVLYARIIVFITSIFTSMRAFYMHKIRIACAILVTIFLTSCAENPSPNIYTTPEVGVASKVNKGTVLSARAVVIDNNSGAGGLAGSVAGAAGGAALGNSASSVVIGAVGGAVVGGVLGNAVDKSANSHRGYEYMIQLEKGRIISIAQSDPVPFRVHQHVLVVYGALTRVVPDDLGREG